MGHLHREVIAHKGRRGISSIIRKEDIRNIREGKADLMITREGDIRQSS